MKTQRLSQSALRDVLEAAADLVESAKQRGGGGVVVSRRTYRRLWAAVKRANGGNSRISAFDDRPTNDYDNDFCYEEGDEW